MEVYKGWKENEAVWVRLGRLWWPALTCTTPHGNMSSIPKDQAFHVNMKYVYKRSLRDHKNWPILQEMFNLTSGQRAALEFLGPLGISFLQLVKEAKQRSAAARSPRKISPRKCSFSPSKPLCCSSSSSMHASVKTMLFPSPSRSSFRSSPSTSFSSFLSPPSVSSPFHFSSSSPYVSSSSSSSSCFPSLSSLSVVWGGKDIPCVTIVEFDLGPVVDRIPEEEDIYPVGLFGPSLSTVCCSLDEHQAAAELRVFPTEDRAFRIAAADRKEMWKAWPDVEKQREELLEVRKSRSNVGCNCRSVRGRDACSSDACSCFANQIDCSVSRFGCGCLSASCINPLGRYQYDREETSQINRSLLASLQPHCSHALPVSQKKAENVSQTTDVNLPTLDLEKSWEVNRTNVGDEFEQDFRPVTNTLSSPPIEDMKVVNDVVLHSDKLVETSDSLSFLDAEILPALRIDNTQEEEISQIRRKSRLSFGDENVRLKKLKFQLTQLPQVEGNDPQCLCLYMTNVS